MPAVVQGGSSRERHSSALSTSVQGERKECAFEIVYLRRNIFTEHDGEEVDGDDNTVASREATPQPEMITVAKYASLVQRLAECKALVRCS